MAEYNPKEIEKKRQEKWRAERLYEPDFSVPPAGEAGAKKPFYNLMMFPYPSAEGLHVGNMYAFTGSDVYGRYKRMRGCDVFEPIGLDGFGIHSENYAMKIGTHPAEQAKISEKNFYSQLSSIGNGFAWEEKLETYDPEYYRFTQWIFTEMFRRGLAYRKKAQVNWCPKCLTVLSDEQAEGGTCERCGSTVEKKELEQWFFRITDYAERLLKNLETLDWSEKVKIAQRNWIGKSEGASIKFEIRSASWRTKSETKEYIEAFTTRPDTIMGVTFIAVPQGSRLAGATAIHPITGAEIPVCAADYVVADYGTAAVMGVPAYDERDRAFAEISGIATSDAPLMDADEAVRACGGKKETRYRLRDWLISRQRYWGPPIPMIFCEKCDWQPVPEDQLPVVLPDVKDFRPQGTGQSPLASAKEFYETMCPKCGGPARRETDVSDTFLDSAWYYLGYLLKAQFRKSDIRNPNLNFGNPISEFKQWLPVHMYIGGAEHSVLHLLYSRFVCMALHDWGITDFDEPFTKFRAHGLIVKDGAKMSKSKGNVVNPDEYIARYGADTLRTYLMFLAPFSQGGDFRDEAVSGVERFLRRVWQLGEQIANRKSPDDSRSALSDKPLHIAIKKVTEDIEALKYNTAISALMICLRELETNGADASQVKTFLQLLAPFAPHMTEELWHMLGEKESVHRSKWPEYDPALLVEDSVEIVVQIAGKVRGTVSVAKDADQTDVERAAREDQSIASRLASSEVKRIIFISNKLINFII